jgi:hypothetical protein
MMMQTGFICLWIKWRAVVNTAMNIRSEYFDLSRRNQFRGLNYIFSVGYLTAMVGVEKKGCKG